MKGANDVNLLETKCGTGLGHSLAKASRMWFLEKVKTGMAGVCP